MHSIIKELGLELILARNARPPKYAFDDVNELLVSAVQRWLHAKDRKRKV